MLISFALAIKDPYDSTASLTPLDALAFMFIPLVAPVIPITKVVVLPATVAVVLIFAAPPT